MSKAIGDMTHEEKLAELAALDEELAREQDKARRWELNRTIAMNTKALPHLRGIPARHAQKRIDDARAELADLDLLADITKRYEDAAAVA